MWKYWKFPFIATTSRNKSPTEKTLHIPVRERQFLITTLLYMHVLNFKTSRKRVMNFKWCDHHLKGNFWRSQFLITAVLKIQVFLYIMLRRWTKSSWARWPRSLKASPFFVTSAVHVMCAVNEVTLVEFFPLATSVSPVSIIPSMLHIHSSIRHAI
jgi:hypothetical protein